MGPAMDNNRGGDADLHSMTAQGRNTELCYVLPCGVSGTVTRFKIGPSNLVERHERDKNDGKHRKNKDNSEDCEETTSWAIVPSPSRRKEWIDFAGSKDTR